mmetsp:Transcript_56031/g.127309  ORF Transcript_56031/g.127309 Transcript_56031/m.127309 type:complete len:318 (+) Transcript_56031:120-1073(+)
MRIPVQLTYPPLPPPGCVSDGSLRLANTGDIHLPSQIPTSPANVDSSGSPEALRTRGGAGSGASSICGGGTEAAVSSGAWPWAWPRKCWPSGTGAASAATRMPAVPRPAAWWGMVSSRRCGALTVTVTLAATTLVANATPASGGAADVAAPAPAPRLGFLGFSPPPPPCGRHFLTGPRSADLPQPGSSHRGPPPWATHRGGKDAEAALLVHSGLSHRRPPPCALHLPDWTSAAPLVHSGKSHRFPPPCWEHRVVGSMALLMQLGSSHRLPPPCALHLSVLLFPRALLVQPGTEHRFPPPCALQHPDRPWADLVQPGT